MERRLAAILAADVVGYSRMMQADEAGTLDALKVRHKEILHPLVAKHRGRIFKLMGDGVLIEFAEAVSALACSVDLQNTLATTNTGLPEERQIVLRIGINVGDVIDEGGDLYGDSVNIAARLETLADPGAIYLSQAVRRAVEDKVPQQFDDLGVHRLKNMSERVQVYRVSGVSAPKLSIAKSELLSKPAIAVLPFTNLGSEPDQQYLSDGIAEDIITELSRYRELLVVARNSSFQYRNNTSDMKRVGRELGADYLVEGSVRKAGDRLRISARLTEAATGGQIWAERYDRDVQDVFAVQDEVTQAVTASLAGQLRQRDTEGARRRPTKSWRAYDYVLRAIDRTDQYDTAEAAKLLHRAIELDPDYALAHAMLAYTSVVAFFEDLKSETLSQALASAQRALSLDELDAFCHCQLGFVLIYFERFDEAEQHIGRAVSLNANNVFFAMHQANLFARIGRAQEALEILDLVVLRDPLMPPVYWELRSMALFQLRRYDDMIKAMLQMNPRQYWDHAVLAAAYAMLGRDAEARIEAAEVLRMKPDFSVPAYAKQDPYKDPVDQRRVLDAFRMAGLPD
jgi:TolB-like protein